MTMDNTVVEEPIIEIDAREYTDTERELILQVVARDEHIRIQERYRLDRLRNELKHLKAEGVPDNEEENNGAVCKRCRVPLGLIFNTGECCSTCHYKVCTKCRFPFIGEDHTLTWTCTFCTMYKVIQAESGAWFYKGPDQPIVKKKEVIYGSMLLKRTFSIDRIQDSIIYKDPSWNDIIESGAIEEIENASEEENAGMYSLHDEKTDYYSNFNKNILSVEVDSVHSGEELDVKPDESLAGDIRIGLKYDHNDNILVVHVYDAKDLPSAYMHKMSAYPYVKVYLNSPTRSLGKKKTKAKKNSLEPEFDELLTFKVEHEELISCVLHISVWHYESTNYNIPLGEVRINMEEFLNSGFTLEDPIPLRYTLYSKRLQFNQLNFCGELIVNLQYKAPGTLIAETTREQRKLPNPTKGQLNIKIIQAKGLTTGGKFYVEMALVITNNDIRKMKSKLVSASEDPYWNEHFVVNNIAWAELERSYLQITLNSMEKKSTFIGGARLGLGVSKDLNHDSFGEEIRAWQGMLDHANESQEYCIPLRDNLGSVKADMAVPPKVVKIITDEEYDEIKNDMKMHSISTAKQYLKDDALSIASTDSLLSIYSSAGQQFDHVVISGEIFFSMKHDPYSNVFSILFIKAKGIAAVNERTKTSDPYVKTYLLPDVTKTTKKKTKHRKQTLKPEWNESVTYSINRDELLKKTLQVSIWNHDRFGRNDFLGEVQVNMQHYSFTNDLTIDSPAWYTLQDTIPDSNGEVDSNKGELKLGIRFDNGVLDIHINQANWLNADDSEKLPNAFVTCYLLPDKSRRSKRKTKVQKGTTSPVWNEMFHYENINLDNLYSRVLEVTVWDHKSTGHQFLGGLRLGLPQGDEPWHDCFGKEINIWEAMIKRLGVSVEYIIPLRATMTERNEDITQESSGIYNEDNMVSMSSEYPIDGPLVRISLQYLESPKLVDAKKKKKKTNKGSLKVYLKEAKNLPIKSKEEDLLPSTFCKGYIHPRKRSSKMRTATYKNSANPLWDTEMLFEGVTLDELRTRALEIDVYDVTIEKKEEMIGYIRLGSGGNIDRWDDSYGIEVEVWRSMLNKPTQSVMMAVPLRTLRITQEIPVDLPSDLGGFDIHCLGAMDYHLLYVIYYFGVKYGLRDEENEVDDEEEKYVESPRTAALRAMCTCKKCMSTANGVGMIEYGTNLMEQHGCTLGIVEEDCYKTDTNRNIVNETPSIIAENNVKPGEPPFPGAGSELDTEVYKLQDSSKKVPSFSLLRQASSFSLFKKSFFIQDSQENLTNMTETVYGQVPIRGEIQFGMKYVVATKTYEVHVLQAKNIAAIDTKMETSDPYCKIYLLPDKSKSGKRKTSTRLKTLCPEWEEVIVYKINIRDLRTRTLWISLWQKGFGPKIFLGEVMLNMSSYVDDDVLDTSNPTWHTLCERGIPPKIKLFKGTIKFGIIFQNEILFDYNVDDTADKQKKKKGNKKNGKIFIHVIECSDLPSADSNGYSDPYCTCYLLPDKSSKTKRKTPTIRHTRNPVWDYKFEYSCDYEDLADHGIEFSVWDWDFASTNDFLGCCRINLGAKGNQWEDAEAIEIEAWQHLIEHPNVWKEFVIPLRSKLDPRGN